MGEFTWRDCGYNSNGMGHGRSTDYEVMLNLTKSSRKLREDKPWEKWDISFTFRNKAFETMDRAGVVAIQISNIMPNSEKIGIMFFTPQESARNSYSRYVFPGSDKKSMIARIPIKNKTEFEVVKGYWQGKYDLKHDIGKDYFYIEAKNVEASRWDL